MKKIILLCVAVCLAGTLSACKSSRGTALSAAEKEAVLAFSEPRTDNLIAGLEAGDYTVFSRDFDPVMQKMMLEGNFEYLKQDRDSKLGKYVSRQVKDVVKGHNGVYTVSYDTVFERDEDVLMLVVFREEEPHEVAGLWFNK